MVQVISDGLRISYDDLGQGEPTLLFLPNWCEPRTVFGQLALRCGLNRRVLMLDWRGHGESQAPADDFGASDLLRDALAVIDASDSRHVVPVAAADAGWIAIELRRRLGHRVPALILLDWFLLEPDLPLINRMIRLQDPMRWSKARDELFASWIADCENSDVVDHVYVEMAEYGFEMWSRAARELSAAYAHKYSPLDALGDLSRAPRTIHIYGQPSDPAYLKLQQSYAQKNPWFSFQRLEISSHFPALEAAVPVAQVINNFLTLAGF